MDKRMNLDCKTKVIVNADDFGMSEEITDIILGFFYPSGIVTSTSILANSNHLSKIKYIVDSNPQISFGIHLNITEGPCLTNNEIFAKYHMIDNEGCFNKSICKSIEYQCCTEELLDAIYCEWKMQMDTLLNAGIHPDHIDGHHHCHTWYGLSKVAIRIANEYHIRLMRNVSSYKQITLKDVFIQNLASLLSTNGLNIRRFRDTVFYRCIIIKMLDSYQCHFDFERLIKENNICTTDLFCDYNAYCIFENDSNKKTVELMCHPGHHACIQQTQMVRDDSYSLNYSINKMLVNYKSILL